MSAEPAVQVDLFAPSLVEATTRRLRDEILSGDLEPGARLIEEQICQRFSISRAPLRESLRLLVQQGLVEHLPRRGARVTIWSDEDIRQLFEIRAVLERHAITTALPIVAEPGVDWPRPLAFRAVEVDRSGLVRAGPGLDPFLVSKPRITRCCVARHV